MDVISSLLYSYHTFIYQQKSKQCWVRFLYGLNWGMKANGALTASLSNTT